MIIADVHCHLDHQSFDGQIDKLIENAKKAGVKAIITNGVNPESNRKALKIAKKYDIVLPALGIYPIDALQRETGTDSYGSGNGFDVDKEIGFIRQNKDKIAAIGEVGMDLKLGKDVNSQREVFGKMLRLADELDKPILIHSRKAEKEVMDILARTKHKKIVMHCFSGKKKYVIEGLKRGYYFSIPTNIVRSFQFQLLVEIAPMSQLLTETDAPYLSPYQGKTNEPAFITETIKQIAEIKKMDKEEVSKILFMNYQKLFA